MIISLNWLKKYTNIIVPIEELSTLIGARLVEIEKTDAIGAKYEDVIVVRIIDSYPMEGSDHLNITKIDDAGKAQNVERDEQGYVQVVCGAPNVRKGLVVAWLPPGSTVPETYGSADPFVLTPKELRGTISNGMLASAKELALFEDHVGILELSDDLTIGSSLTTALELDDSLLDIENKSLTHRPDTFGIIGFAREVAAIQDLAFVTPDWLSTSDPDYGEKQGDVIPLSIVIENPDLSSRYQSVVLSDADSTRKSPLWVQSYLSRVGVRPINAVVDATNYLMMLTGQPLHAFDYDKVVALAGETKEIHVRSANENESLELLDGRTISLERGDIVIAAGETAIGLAGAMGGLNTVIDEHTTNIIIEAATFNLYNLRSTQMRHGIFSEAITRFTKGQPAELTAPVLAETIRLIHEWSGAQRVSAIAESYVTPQPTIELPLSIAAINELLGTTLTVDEAISALRNTEFSIENIEGDSFTVRVPFWRSDIHIVEDVIEEVGRLRGFDSITPELPERTFEAVQPSSFDEFRARVRKSLVRSGANEVLTYSFIHGDNLKKAFQQTDNSYRVTNSISPNLQYYRQSITPSLLQNVYPNSKQGYETFALFELNTVHQKSRGLSEENVPIELHSLGFVLTNKKTQKESYFYKAKHILDYLGKTLGVTFVYTAVTEDTIDDVSIRPFEARRSATVHDARTGVFIGVVGEYKTAVTRSFKLLETSAGFELDIDVLFAASESSPADYVPLSKYPSSERDICFQVANDITYGQIIDAVHHSFEHVPVAVKVSPLDIYQPESKLTKNSTIRLSFTSSEKTLTGEEVNGYLATISTAVVQETNAVII